MARCHDTASVVRESKPSVNRDKTQVSLRVMLVDDNDAGAADVTEALLSEGDDVVAILSSTEDMLASVRRVQPDVLVVDMDHAARDVLDNCVALTQLVPTPIVFFAKSSDIETISEAVRGGISAYVVGRASARRLRPILVVAIARFREHQRLRGELDDMRTRLSDRRDVERAKATLSKLRNLDESAAYAVLRRSAMARRITVGEAARTLLAASDLLAHSPD